MTWKDELKENVTTLEELKEYVHLTPEEEEQLKAVVDIHPMSVTKYYLSLIDREDPNDPIRRLAVPSTEELNLIGSYDTSGEAENTKMPGLQHKYAQTALVLATNRCATYCRHCFRKRLVGLPNKEIIRIFRKAAEYIGGHEEINNVLISGGDPLILPTDVIRTFLDELSKIDHLDFIRFGSRVPVTFPQRILEDGELLEMLGKFSRNQKRIYLVTHFNHPKEITPEAISAVDKLIRSGILVSNQTVLLKGVNDDPAVLADLLNKLVTIGVSPYYVFQCRPVKRVKHHFQVPLRTGYEVVEAAKTMLNGHSKRFKYIMSHRSGKIEIVGVMDDEIYLKYHQAKNPDNIGKFFKLMLNDTAGWLDDLVKISRPSLAASASAASAPNPAASDARL